MTGTRRTPGRQLPHLRAYRDRADRHHFGLASDAQDAVTAWAEAVQRLFDGSLEPSSPAYLLACMILLEGIETVDAIGLAWLAMPKLYRDGDGQCCLEWCDAHGRDQRRHLSSVTVLSYAQQTKRTSLEVASRELLSAYSGCFPDLSALLELVQRAMVLMLSGDLSAHVIGRQPLTAVSRSCLVRKATGTALMPNPSLASDDARDAHTEADQGANVGAVSLSLLDALHSGRAGGGSTLVERMVEAVRPDAQALPGAAQQRASMQCRLHALAPACEADGAWSALLLLFALQLVRVGTRFTSPLAPRTITEYVSLGLPLLARALSATSIDQAATLDWNSAVYASILAEPTVPVSQLGKLAASLAAFHDLVVTVLGALPLGARLSPELPEPRVVANIIWPHEIVATQQMLGAAPADDRLMAQAMAMLAILRAAACRYEDVLHIHLFGVRADGITLRIAIDPLPSAGSGKSAAARRTLEITEPCDVALILAWVERRQVEGSTPRDLLFGDPDDGRRPWRPGASLGILNAALKATTGDPEIGTHDLRHSFLSCARESMTDRDQRRLDELSAAAGHEWTSTTLKHYCHLYERPLRCQLDEQLQQLPLTERAACRLGGFKPGMLRKRSQRAGGSSIAVIWQALHTAASAVVLPSVCHGYASRVPLNPFREGKTPLNFARVFATLRDWSAGHSEEARRLRQGLDTSQLTALQRAVAAWYDLALRSTRRSPTEDTSRPPWDQAWQRAGQVKWLTVRRALEIASVERLQPVVDSWARVAAPRHITLQDLPASLSFLQWLASTGMEGGQMVLGHEPAQEPQHVCELIDTLFGQPPRLRPVRPRRGRSGLYLTVASASCCEHECPSSNAAISIAGLHALMFAAWVWVRLSGGSHG